MSTSPTDISQMLEKQLQLQLRIIGDPRDLEGAELMEYIRTNVLALEDELHEALRECGWKPWATSKHLNREAFMKEMVDAWHFFMNIMLGISPGMSPEALAAEFAEKYYAKNQVNQDRQRTGYDGVANRCRNCHKDLDQAGVSLYSPLYAGSFCDRTCVGEYGRKVREYGAQDS
ncbi:MAG: hypothetical protein DMF62_04700 [Acidobacteria bacterium]|nr:MAG: hypothetical protein DMF62_04700 [Acidobacteriota bacterium]